MFYKEYPKIGGKTKIFSKDKLVGKFLATFPLTIPEFRSFPATG